MIFVLYNTTTTCTNHFCQQTLVKNIIRGPDCFLRLVQNSKNGSLGLSQVMDTTYDSKSYCNPLFDTIVRLSLPAIKQILLSSGAVTDQKEKDLLRKIEQSAMRLLLIFNNLTIKEWFNVLKIQNHVDTSLDMVRLLCLFLCKKFDTELGFKCL